jgi:Flp pilus assembly protein TadG
MVEFSYFFYVKNAFQNAAREGVRSAMTPSGTTSSATTAVTNALASYHFPTSSVTATVTDTSGNTLDPSTAAIGTAIQVNVTATWSVIGAGFRPLTLISGSKTVTGLCVMQKE